MTLKEFGLTIAGFVQRLALGAVSGIVIASAAQAQVTAYKCDMKNYGRGYANSDQMFLQLDQGKGVALVYDGLIANENDKKPVVAKYTMGSNGRYKLRYSVDVTYKNHTTGRADFIVTFFPGRNDLHLSAGFAGADNNGMGGRGKCKAVKPVEFK